MQIYQRFKEVRKSLKLNQTDFASKLGMTMRAIQKWEAGEIEDKIYKFMEHFNTKSDDLDFQTKELIVKGCIVRDLLERTPNPRVQVPDMPFNLKKDEKLIYAFQIKVSLF